MKQADMQFKQLTYEYLKIKDLLTDMDERIASKESVISDLRSAQESTKDRYRDMEKRALEAESKVQQLQSILDQQKIKLQDNSTSSGFHQPSAVHGPPLNNNPPPFPTKYDREQFGASEPSWQPPGLQPDLPQRHLLHNQLTRSNWGKMDLEKLPKFNGSVKGSG